MEDHDNTNQPASGKGIEQAAEAAANQPTIDAGNDARATPEQPTLAKANGKKAPVDSVEEQTAVVAGGDDEDPDTGEAFPVYPPVEGEFLVPASRLGVHSHHPRRGSRRVSDHASTLALSAGEPLVLRPIVVIRADDGSYAVIDGRFRLEAIKAANAGNRDVEVRCMLFHGTEAEAVAHLCDEGLGSVGMTQIEQARALFSLQQTSNVSQTEIAKRYPRFTITKVNNMLRAARVWDQWPDLFDVLNDPDRVSVDYGVKLFTLMKRLEAKGQEALLDRARDLVANHERFSPSEALKALRIDDEDEADEEEPTPEIEDIFGADDQPLGTAEQLADDRLRLTLPSSGEIEGMSAGERQENAAPFIARIRQHFGMEEG